MRREVTLSCQTHDAASSFGRSVKSGSAFEQEEMMSAAEVHSAGAPPPVSEPEAAVVNPVPVADVIFRVEILLCQGT